MNKVKGLYAQKVIPDGNTLPDFLQIAPTVMKNVAWDNAVMQDSAHSYRIIAGSMADCCICS